MLATIDVVILVVSLVLVAAVSILASRGERSRDDYFLAGRKLTWWLIGISLIASNISTEHFVGMTGNAARNGIAVAGYEWVAAIALVFVAWWILPVMLRAGIYTMPEFLEYRFDRMTRSIMAALMVVFFVLTVLATVLFAGSTFLSSVLDLPGYLQRAHGMSAEGADTLAFQIGVWGIGIAAGVYTVFGGLKAVVWSDLIQGLGLLIGGVVLAVLALVELGGGQGMVSGWQNFTAAQGDKMHLVRPLNDPDLPWLALLTGIWIPVIFYWGLNQFITQRTLGAGSLKEGQKGVIFAAGIKLILPLIIVIPGMMAVQILSEKLDPSQMDSAYPMLMKELLPVGVLGLMIAAVAGSIMSTFNSGLNSAATVFTLDLWSVYVRKDMTERQFVTCGRTVTAILAVAACLWAPVIRSFDGVFGYIQEFWGFVSAPTAAVFFVGLLMRRVPAGAARTAFIVGPLFYLASRSPSWIWTSEEAEHTGGIVEILYQYSSLSFLYHMFILFALLVGMMALWGKLNPLPTPAVLPNRPKIDMQRWRGARPTGALVIAATIAIYLFLW